MHRFWNSLPSDIRQPDLSYGQFRAVTLEISLGAIGPRRSATCVRTLDCAIAVRRMYSVLYCIRIHNTANSDCAVSQVCQASGKSRDMHTQLLDQHALYSEIANKKSTTIYEQRRARQRAPMQLKRVLMQ